MGETGAAGGSGAGAGVLKYAVPGFVGALSLVVARRWGAPLHVAAPDSSCPHHDHHDHHHHHSHHHHPHQHQHSAAPGTSGVSRRRRLKEPPLKAKPTRHHHQQQQQQANQATPPSASQSAQSNHQQSEDGGPGVSPAMGAPIAPKHAPFPPMPRDDDLVFELTVFAFTALATATQFLNLYRTVWWLPHSYNTQTMNFYLIDDFVVLFILFALGRRLLFSLLKAAVRTLCPERFATIARTTFMYSTFYFTIFALGLCIYRLVPHHPILSMFFLCYPISIYLLLFGARIAPSVQLENPNFSVPHCCANGASGIRNEVELLKTDYNYRLKQVIFSSLIGAYYASFVPWCFAQPFLQYDVFQIVRHLGLVWFGLFIQHAAHCFSAQYCDQLHRAALHLGRWVRKSSASTIGSNGPLSGSSATTSSFSLGPQVNPWCNKTLWAPGSSVRHGRFTYTSFGCMTAAEPGNMMHFRFYTLFYNPSHLLCCLLIMQVALVMLILVLLVYTIEWNFILSLVFLLLSNYYTLFKLVRDCFVSWKVYQMENRIFEKNLAQSA